MKIKTCSRISAISFLLFSLFAYDMFPNIMDYLRIFLPLAAIFGAQNYAIQTLSNKISKVSE